ncbi:MAG TPA: hypothetical protein VK327_11300 [Candidatus Paceibacterota bacterium]|nr:hypothetical protein [Candidatus Paceibacterota bacterium]
MKLNLVLPWILVLGLSAGLGTIYVKSAAKDTELTRLQSEAKEVEQLRADLAAAQEKAQVPEDQVLVSKKDKEELIRLRGEIGRLRGENQKIASDLALSKSRADAAAAQADAAAKQTEAVKAQVSAALTSRNNYEVQQRNACINNLRQIDAAKQQWAVENNKQADAIPTAQEIAVYLPNNTVPSCPASGVYTIGSVSRTPTCSIPGHALTQ